MSQSTISVSDGTGNEVLNALNRLFAAISTLQSGDTEPATPNPLMLWADTANNLLKIRSIENNAWIELGQISHSGLFVGKQAITSDKIAPQAVRLTHIQRGPAGTVLVAKGEQSDPTWEAFHSAYQNRSRVLTAQGSQSDPIWATLSETFDGWCVGDAISIEMNYASFSSDEDSIVDSGVYGSARASGTITSTSKTSFTFSGSCSMSATDIDLFFNDYFSHSGTCTGTVSSNYYGHISSSGGVNHDPMDRFYWDCSGWVNVHR